MTPREAVILTRYVKACCPQQAIDEYTADAWHDLLGDLDAGDCRAVVVAITRRQPFVAPAEIRDEVRRVREQRLANSDLALPAADPADEKAYRRALAEIMRRLGDGQPPPFRAIEAAGHSEPSAEFRETRDDLAARRRDNTLAKARDAEPTGEQCDCGAYRDPDGVCRACQTWEETS